jgi:hypothetical protein
MSISKVKALRASAEAEVFAQDVKHNVDHNYLLSTAFSQRVKPLPFGVEHALCLANLLN